MWFILTFIPLIVLGQPLSNREKAEKIIDHVLKIKIPTKSSNPFEHWVHNTASLTGIHCWNTLTENARDPKADGVKNSNFTAGGVWQLPREEKVSKLCDSLAEKGFHPFCVSSFVRIEGVEPKPGIPLNYVQVYKDKPLKVTGLLKCYIDKDQISIQDYAGPLEAEWSEKPVWKKLLLNGQRKEWMAGTLMIKSNSAPDLLGRPYREPRTAIIINP